MNNARIYCQSKPSSQSARAGVGKWIVQMDRSSSQNPEPIMGWTQTSDTLNQIKMVFSTCEKAEAFAKSQGWRYTVTKQNARRVKPRNYGDNFVCEMTED